MPLSLALAPKNIRFILPGAGGQDIALPVIIGAIEIIRDIMIRSTHGMILVGDLGW